MKKIVLIKRKLKLNRHVTKEIKKLITRSVEWEKNMKKRSVRMKRTRRADKIVKKSEE